MDGTTETRIAIGQTLLGFRAKIVRADWSDIRTLEDIAFEIKTVDAVLGDIDEITPCEPVRRILALLIEVLEDAAKGNFHESLSVQLLADLLAAAAGHMKAIADPQHVAWLRPAVDFTREVIHERGAVRKSPD